MSNLAQHEAEKAAALALAKKYTAEVWRLLEGSDRDARTTEQMKHAAHAAHRLLRDLPDLAEQQRSLWVLSRVYAEVGNGPEALIYATRCSELTNANEDQMRDFDKAYALEAKARAHAVCDELTKADTYYTLAFAEAQDIARAEDREIFEKDLKSGNWGRYSGQMDA